MSQNTELRWLPVELNFTLSSFKFNTKYIIAEKNNPECLLHVHYFLQTWCNFKNTKV